MPVIGSFGKSSDCLSSHLFVALVLAIFEHFGSIFDFELGWFVYVTWCDAPWLWSQRAVPEVLSTSHVYFSAVASVARR